jgi:hypothetical protein
VQEAREPTNTPSDADYGDMGQTPLDEIDDYDSYDKLLGAEMMVDFGDGDKRRGKVIKRLKGEDGRPIGRAHSNPRFDTREYLVEYEDGTTDRYLANTIAENMFSQIDDEGKSHSLMKEIVDHQCDGSALTKEQAQAHERETGKPKQTTKGWKLCVQWKDDSTTWVPLREIKESNPIEVAEYAYVNQLHEEPAFKWWVPYVIRKR